MRRGSVVAITGASSGIGAATAAAFARRGCRLVLGARREAVLVEVCVRLQQRYGVECVAVHCDVRSAADVQALVQTAVEHFGRLDVIVNNAGLGLYGRVEDTVADDFRELLETNVLGVHHGIRAALPVMRRQHSGHIVVVGSAAGKRSWPFHGPYSATKFALDGLTQALRAELAGSGVTASLIIPASTKTSFFETAKVVTRGLVPEPIGVVQPPEVIAEKIVRSVDHPAPEVDALRRLRPAFVLAEAFPRLADAFAKRYYSRTAKRLSLDAAPEPAGTDDTAATTSGTA